MRAGKPALPLRIVTHNIRYAVTPKPGSNEQPWEVRRKLIGKQLRWISANVPATLDGSTIHTGATLICLQEVLHHQLEDVLASLNADDNNESTEPTWAYIGVGREDGKQLGEYSPIIYSPRILKLVHSETRWLSSTPDIPSKGWGAWCYRTVTIGVFSHQTSGLSFIAMNTHLEHGKSQANIHTRRESISVILNALQQVRKEWLPGNSAAVLAGDFNSMADTEGDAYQTLAASGQMAEIREYTADEDRYGDQDTYTGFGHGDVGAVSSRIDFIWLGPTVNIPNDPHSPFAELWSVKKYSVLPNRYEDGVYCSDHRPVIGDVVLTLN